MGYTDYAQVTQEQCSTLKNSLSTDMTQDKMVILQRTWNAQWSSTGVLVKSFMLHNWCYWEPQ